MRVRISQFFVMILTYFLQEKLVGDWLRGRALPSHGRGRGFKSRIAHHFFLIEYTLLPAETHSF